MLFDRMIDICFKGEQKNQNLSQGAKLNLINKMIN